MNREVETIREKVHTTADAALFLCFQEVKGSHSKGVIRLPLLHYDIPFEGYGEMLRYACGTMQGMLKFAVGGFTFVLASFLILMNEMGGEKTI